MIIDAENKPERPLELDLRGPEGNVFNLMNLAKVWGRQLGIKNPDAIVELMKMGTYDEAVEVFDNYFGNLVIIYK